jgi:hypothetical protein
LIAGLALLGGLALGIYPVAAQQSDDVSEKLRSALRQATSQLQDLQDQNATLTAKAADAEKQRAAMAQKLAEDEKELAGLRSQSRSASAAAETEKENVAKWETAYKQAADTARSRDAADKELQAGFGKLKQRESDCEAKNAELYKLGHEVLDLYQDKGVFEVLVAEEPVTQLKRVEEENKAQGMEDKLRDNQLAPATH